MSRRIYKANENTVKFSTISSACDAAIAVDSPFKTSALTNGSTYLKPSNTFDSNNYSKTSVCRTSVFRTSGFIEQRPSYNQSK